MADVKIHFKLGAIEFSGEGDKEWIAQQLDKLLDKAPKLVSLSPPAAQSGGIPPLHAPGALDPLVAHKPLASFLQEKNATSNQVKKFLAAAVWLEAKGRNKMTTGDVTKALKDSHQSGLGNPADCLNRNVGKGYCEKDGKEFFVTQTGRASL